MILYPYLLLYYTLHPILRKLPFLSLCERLSRRLVVLKERKSCCTKKKKATLFQCDLNFVIKRDIFRGFFICKNIRNKIIVLP
jgi:hypothetical protein